MFEMSLEILVDILLILSLTCDSEKVGRNITVYKTVADRSHWLNL